MEISEAFEILKQKMFDDSSYAWVWHCNIAMAVYDEGCGRFIGNKGAARFMKLCFDVDTTQLPEYQDIMSHYMES